MIGEIELYAEPVRERETTFLPRPTSGTVNLTASYARKIDDVIQDHLQNLGYDKRVDVATTNQLSPRRRKILQDRVKRDWRMPDLVRKIVNAENPKILETYTPKQLLSLIGLIDWNETDKATMTKAAYEDGKLTVYGLRQLHSYLVQLTRNENFNEKFPRIIDSPSVSGIILSSDDLTQFPIGYRGGKNLPNTGMTVPAGSVQIPEIDPSDGDYIFESFHHHLTTELGQGREDLDDARIIGRIFDRYVGGNSLFVVVGQSKLTKEQMIERREGATDSWQHKRLMFLGNDSESISTALSNHDISYDKRNLPEVPDGQLPFLHPLKQSLVLLGMSLDPNFKYQIIYQM